MATHESNSGWTDASASQIHQLEQRIILRRQLINHKAGKLRCNFRQALTKPATLLTAGSIGLAMGVMLKHRTRATSTYTKTGKLTQLFANALKLIAMARALAMALPADSPYCTYPNKPGIQPGR